MANTASTTSPIAPHGGVGGMLSGFVCLAQSNAAIVKGDILATASGKAGPDNANPAVVDTIGVALEDVAATDTLFHFMPALPGVRFEANMIQANGTDEVSGVYAQNIGLATTFEEEDQDGNACLIDSNGTNTPITALTLYYGKQRPDAANPNNADPFLAGVGVRNPRVVFVFTSSAFNMVV